MVNLNNIKQKKPASAAGKNAVQLTDYSGNTAERVDEWLSLKRQKKSIEGQMKVIEGGLKRDALDFMFKSNHNKDRPDTTVEAVGKSGTVKVIFQDMYSPIQITEDNEERITELKQTVGDNFDSLFKEDFVLSIIGSQIDKAQQQNFVDELCNLLTMYGADDAIEAKSTVAPLKDVFHTRRHTLYSPEDNMKLNTLIQGRTMIR